MNVLDEIVLALTDEHDLVVDPFMGSGTTLFSAIGLHRRAYGSDISPLSDFLVKAIGQLINNGSQIIGELEKVLEQHANMVLPWYALTDDRFVDRVRFRVDGDYSHGDFTLHPIEVVSKTTHDNRQWGKRKVETGVIADITDPVDHTFLKYIQSPIDFGSLVPPENSRIAVPAGANLSHYFTRRNQASINVFLKLIADSVHYRSNEAAMKLLLSASLPMLRLSDRKASSQWPFWRPKNNLTTRNPVMVFQSKLKALKSFTAWAESKFPDGLSDQLNVKLSAAQDLELPASTGKANLVLTDPPYGDQVPYLEYSNLWNGILSLEFPSGIARQEIVKSNGAHNRSVSDSYEDNLSAAMKANIGLLGNGGFLVWYFQEHNLGVWSRIYQSVIQEGASIVDLIGLQKQRRSLKTVTSPDSTLDGDLLIIICNGPIDANVKKRVSDLSNRLSDSAYRSRFFQNYVDYLRETVISGSIVEESKNYKTVKKALYAREL